MARKKKGAPNWIAAMSLDEGSFGAKAKRAGKTTAQYAKDKARAPGKLGKQARLAQTFSKLRKKRGK